MLPRPPLRRPALLMRPRRHRLLRALRRSQRPHAVPRRRRRQLHRCPSSSARARSEVCERVCARLLISCVCVCEVGRGHSGASRRGYRPASSTGTPAP